MSFVLPTRLQFSNMPYDERTKVLTEVWESRYIIMNASDADDVVDEFFCMFHEMLLEDKELCQRENELEQE